MKKPLFTVFLMAVMISGLILANTAYFNVVHASTNVTGIITTNVTWTKANSPYMLTGPVAVNVGVTLTIEAGTVVNLNNYYIQVNGTLFARGVSTSLIQFSNGTLYLTPLSNGWNDTAGSGCIIEYASLTSVSISASNAMKLNQDTIYSDSVTVGNSSVITNNIAPSIFAGDSSTFLNNQINGSIIAGASCTFSKNNIKFSISAGDKSTVTGNTAGGGVGCAGNQSTITNNVIQGAVNGGVILNNTIYVNAGRFTVQGTIVRDNNITGGTVSASLEITNNIIVSGNYTEEFRVFGGYATYIENTPAIIIASGKSPLISGNTITGGGSYTAAFIFDVWRTILPAIDLSSGGSATISNNVITGRSGLAINGNSYSISNNIAIGDFNGSASMVYNNTVQGSVIVNAPIVFNNTVQGSVTVNGGNPTISNNTFSAGISVNAPSCNITGNTANKITTSQGNSYISDNTVKNGTGISITGGGMIVRNFIANNDVGNTSGITIVNGTLVIDGPIGISVVDGTAMILNNTISDNSVGILLYPSSVGTKINYNNFLSNGLNIVLAQGTTNNFDATYNWWGTTNTQAINQTIHDFKNDFNLGNIIFTPFLTAPNPNAMPNPNATNEPPVIPEEFPSWTIITVLVIAALAGTVAIRKKTKTKPST